MNLREQTKEIYKGLSWTRIVSLQHYDTDTQRKWPIGTDISEEHDVLFTIDEDGLPEFQPAFDPTQFIKLNPNPIVGAWRLPEQTLYE